jgi:hypothetical protein
MKIWNMSLSCEYSYLKEMYVLFKNSTPTICFKATNKQIGLNLLKDQLRS